MRQIALRVWFVRQDSLGVGLEQQRRVVQLVGQDRSWMRLKGQHVGAGYALRARKIGLLVWRGAAGGLCPAWSTQLDGLNVTHLGSHNRWVASDGEWQATVRKKPGDWKTNVFVSDDEHRFHATPHYVCRLCRATFDFILALFGSHFVASCQLCMMFARCKAWSNCTLYSLIVSL